MNVLLDTCEFLWWISNDPKLSASILRVVQNTQNQVFLSVVSLWEITVKYALGKLVLPEPPAQFIALQRELHQIASLPLEEASVAYLSSLPFLHRDPFDRMLICQAQAHGLTLASSDPLIRQYPVRLI